MHDRVAGLLRRSSEKIAEVEIIRLGGLTIFPQDYRIEVDGEMVELTRTEMRILAMLARRPDRVYTFTEILDRCHPEDTRASDRAVKVAVHRVREKLGRYRLLIKAVRGVGYTLRPKMRPSLLMVPIFCLMEAFNRLSKTAKATMLTATTATAITVVGVEYYTHDAPWYSPVPAQKIQILGLRTSSFIQAQRDIRSLGPDEGHFVQSIYGGFGSALAYTGEGDAYLTVSFPAPSDPRPFINANTFHIAAQPEEHQSVRMYALDSIALRTEVGRPLQIQWAADSETNKHRFSAPTAAVRISPAGTLFVLSADGRAINEHARTGQRLRSITIPPHFDRPPAHAELDPGGHLAARPLEALALTPEGRLCAVGRRPLPGDTRSQCADLRIWCVDTLTGRLAEYLVPLEDPRHTVHELLAVGNERLLMLERGTDPDGTRYADLLFLVDLSAASDVSRIPESTEAPLNAQIRVADKTLAIDLMAHPFNRRELQTARIEGLTFGPDLSDGRKLLMAAVEQERDGFLQESVLAFALHPSVLERN